MLDNKLSVFQKAVFDENIVKEQEHTSLLINKIYFIYFSNGYLYLELVFNPKNEGDAPKVKCVLTNNVGTY
ncbi:hypothetical protein HUJ04_008286 [Dendroctonus ponderosae]|nr:hypothetical protein HUJ04_008286 [Dendroctonus ponderosae]KAH1008151.1 hypothetical protein HUJ05_008732 [Dendroctonus ponderosae]